MHRYIYYLTTLFILFLFQTVKGQVQCLIPPAPDPFVETQPDGSQITLQLRGSAYNYWKETEDGYTVVKNKDGYYEFAMKTAGKLMPSGFRVKAAKERLSSLMPGGITKHLSPDLTPELEEQLRQQSAAAPHTHTSPLSGSGYADETADTLRVLVCLIEFPDYRHSFGKSDFEAYFNGEGGQYPSMREYFREVSNGKLIMEYVLSNWAMAEHNISYYGKRNGDARGRTLAAEAIQGAMKQGMDFKQFDRNNDKIIDAVLALHAGAGAEEGGNDFYVWSHKWGGLSIQADGINVYEYATFPETRNYYGRNGMVGIGVACHELSHLLGLPDLYDTRTGGAGVGDWSLMAGGSWSGSENFPTHPEAWSKEQMGWARVENITAKAGQYKLPPVVDEGVVYRIDTYNSDEYFLLENRRQRNLDRSVAGNGLAIWHINKLKAKTLFQDPYNNVNAYGQRGVDLEEADGTDINLYHRGSANNLYRWEGNFNLSSTPNSDYAEPKASLGTQSGVHIEHINLRGDTVFFDFESRFPGAGESCDDPVVVREGENKTHYENNWYSFTMPADGIVYVNADTSHVSFEVFLHKACNTQPFVSSGTTTTNPLEIRSPLLKKGEKILIQWRVSPYESEENKKKFLAWHLTTETGGINEQDSLALVAYYNQMGGTQWSDEQKHNWLKAPVASWGGVTVKKGRVVALDGYVGQGAKAIPDAFYNLMALERLTFNIYSELGMEIVFSEKMVSLKHLKYLHLNFPKARVDFFSKLSSMESLEYLHVEAVKEISHGLPEDIGELKPLTILRVQADTWHTTLPESLGDLFSLVALDLKSPQLSGAIPESLGGLQTLLALKLLGPLTGSLPAALGGLDSLTELSLENTKLSGAIPAELGNIKLLRNLTITNAALSGAIPATLMDMPVLTHLNLSGNALESLPENFLQNPRMRSINLSRNQLKGKLPQEASFEEEENFSLWLEHNALSGNLPAWMPKVQWDFLNLSYNQFEGHVPRLKVYESLYIEHNRFTSMESFGNSGDHPRTFTIYCAGNHLSFDDLLANRSWLDIWYQDIPADYCEDFDCYATYRPQDTVHMNIREVVAQGDTFRIKLGIDSAVQENVYYWFKDDEPVDTTTTNYLDIQDFDQSKAGRYRTEVKHEGGSFDSLTLYYDGIELQSNGRQPQVIIWTGPGKKTYGDEPFTMEAKAQGEGPVNFTVVEGVNLVSLEGNQITIHGAGAVKIKASHLGDSIYNPVDSIFTFTIDKAAQEIVYTQPKDHAFGEADFLLEAEASSKLPLSLQVIKGNVKLQGKLVTILGAGEVEIRASQAGNDNYQSAKMVTIRFNVAKLDQYIVFDPIADRIYGDPAFTLSATSSQRLPVSLKALTDNIEIKDGKVIILAAGEVRIEASQAGDDRYMAAQTVVRDFMIAKREQLLYLDTISNKTIGDKAFTVRAISNAGLAVTLEAIEGAALVDISRKDNQSFQLTVKGAGNVVLQVSQQGDANHEAAETLQEDFFIFAAEEEKDKSPQLITVSALPDTVNIDEEVAFKAEVSSGLKPVIKLEGPGEFSADTTSVKTTAAGTIILRVSQLGNEEYLPAEQQVRRIVVRTMAVERLEQVITFNDIADTLYVDDVLILQASSSSGKKVKFRILEGHQQALFLTVDMLELLHEGSVTVEAYEEGDLKYESAAVSQTFYIKDRGDEPEEPGRETQLITYTVVQDHEKRYGDAPFALEAESNAGLPVTVTVDGADYNDGMIEITKPGIVTVTISQAGNEEYQPVDTTFTFIVDKGLQQLSFGQEHIEQLTDSTFLLKAVSDRELEVRYQIQEGNASLESNLLTVHESGEIKVQASQAGNELYEAAAPVVQTLRVDLVTGIVETLEREILLYPNPTANLVHLQLPYASKSLQYRLFDSQGKLLANGILKGEELDMSQWSEGTYMLYILYQDQWISKKIIKEAY